MNIFSPFLREVNHWDDMNFKKQYLLLQNENDRLLANGNNDIKSDGLNSDKGCSDNIYSNKINSHSVNRRISLCQMQDEKSKQFFKLKRFLLENDINNIHDTNYVRGGELYSSEKNFKNGSSRSRRRQLSFQGELGVPSSNDISEQFLVNSIVEKGKDNDNNISINENENMSGNITDFMEHMDNVNNALSCSVTEKMNNPYNIGNKNIKKQKQIMLTMTMRVIVFIFLINEVSYF